MRRKGAALRRALAPLGLSPDALPAVAHLPSPFGHRTKLLMPAAGAASDLRFGLYRRGSLDLVPAEGCPAQHPLTLGVLAQVASLLRARRIAATGEPGPRAWLNAVGVRVDPRHGEAQVLLAASHPPAGVRSLAAEIGSLPGISSVSLAVAGGRSSYPVGEALDLLHGAARASFSVAGQRFAIGPCTFWQTSAAGADLLAAAALELLPTRMTHLLDLYAGAGVFTRLAAGRWRRATTVESSASAVSDLRHGVAGQPLPELHIIERPVEDALPEVLRARPDVAIVDPPRRGLKPAALDALCRAGPPCLVYVACGVPALIRDATALAAAGYRPTAARAVDLFPHTTHLEAVVRLERQEGGA